VSGESRPGRAAIALTPRANAPWPVPIAGIRRRASQSRGALYFVLTAIVCQLALLTGPTGVVRIALRIALYAASLLMLVAHPRARGRMHPAVPFAIVALIVVGLATLHPTTNSPLAGGAHALLYLAILAPLFWATRLGADATMLRRILLILWIFHSVSAAVGVLQVVFPGQFQPRVSSMILGQEGIMAGYLESLRIGDQGRRTFRPMGLTDIPGGAAIAAYYAVFFGLVFLVGERGRGWRLLSTASILIGSACLYLAQIRAMMVVALVASLGFWGVLVLRGRTVRAVRLTVAVLVATMLGISAAVALGGSGTSARIASLTQSPASEVYYSHRGHFLRETVEQLLPQYPLGAGLGRWGMMYAYFGDNSDPDRGSLWVEIQWTGWLFDGGIPLILAYFGALLVTLRFAWRASQVRAVDARHDVSLWGAALFGHDLGVLALIFSYPYFIGDLGIQFWMLNALLFSAVQASSWHRMSGRNA
jgi:hypothetical protein